MNGNIMRRLCAFFLLFAGLISLAAGQAKDVVPGDSVFVTTSPDLKPDDTPTVALKPNTDTLKPNPDKYTVVVDAARHGLTISLSSDIVTGQYEITAQRTSQGSTQSTPFVPAPKVINVQPVVTSIDPKALYRNGGNTLTFLGPASLKYDTENGKPYNNYEISFEDHALTPCKDGKYDPTNCFIPGPNSHDGQIQFQINPAFLNSLSGKQAVYLVHNGAKSQAQTLTVVAADTNTPRNAALAVAAGLVVLVYLLLSAGRRGLQGNERGSLLSALFLDEETQTYSLSKCQFYAWTLAAILGYVFLAMSMSVVQGSAVFPDIPDGLPAIILASAGTAVLATGITSSKGSKGAGAVHPTLADFITNGGVVAPERLQFVVWTVVGIVTFLTIVFNSDPLKVNGLPKIPSGFLELMGISSAGYLGGKLARKPGPVIKVISVAKVTEIAPLDEQYRAPNIAAANVQYPVLTLHLQGENLDPKGSVKVDGQALRGDLFYVMGTPDPQNNGFSSELNVTLYSAATYIKDTHTLTLVNSDSQSADVLFPVDALKIESVSDRDAATGNATVTGKNFVAPTYYQWRDAQGTIVPVDPANPNALNLATVQNPTTLTVARPAAIAQGYKLTLISATRLRAEKTI